MTFARTNPAGWSIGATFTSAQGNDLDIKTSQALDKVGGDTIGTGVTITWAAGSILAMAGSLNVSGGATWSTGSNSYWNSGATATFNAGSTLIMGGSLSVQSPGSIGLRGTLTVDGSGGGLGKIQTNQPGLIVLGGGSTDWVALSATRTLGTRMMSPGFAPIQTAGGWTQKADLIVSTASASSCYIACPQLYDGATLASIDLYVLPTSGARTPSSPGSTTLLYRTPAAGAFVPLQAVAAGISWNVAGWGDGFVKKITGTINATVSAGNVYVLNIIDESGGTYPAGGGNQLLGVGFNYTIADMRPA